MLQFVHRVRRSGVVHKYHRKTRAKLPTDVPEDHLKFILAWEAENEKTLRSGRVLEQVFDMNNADYAPTTYQGVVRGLAGEDRGVYFIACKGDFHRLIGTPKGPTFEYQVKKILGDGLTLSTPEDDEILKWAKLSLRRCAERTEKSGRGFDLTIDSIVALWHRQEGRCDFSDIKMNFTASETSNRRPFGPSLDRIDGSKGYLQSNVRIICTIANIARSDFTDGELMRFCNGAARNSLQEKPPANPAMNCNEYLEGV